MRACRLRRACARKAIDGKVTLVGDENELPYHKPPLSKTFIKDAQAKPQILRAEAFYTGADIEPALGESVERIDLAGKRLDLAGGGATRLRPGHPCHRLAAARAADRRRTACRRPVAALHRRRPRHSRACGGVEDVVDPWRRLHRAGNRRDACGSAAGASPSSKRRTGFLARVVAPAISAHVAEAPRGIRHPPADPHDDRAAGRRKRPCRGRASPLPASASPREW